MLRVTFRVITAIAVVAAFSGGIAAAQVGTTPKPSGQPTTPAATPTATGDGKADDEKQPQEIRDAIEAFKKRDFEGAYKLFQQAAKKDPDMPSARLLMAQFFSQTNNVAAMRNSLEMAVIESPNDPHTYVVLADLALRDRRVTEALLLYDKASSLLPEWKVSAERKRDMQIQIYHGIARSLQLRGNWAAAQKELENWLKLDPKSVPAYQELAHCLFQQKNPEGALDKLKQAAKIDENIVLPETTIAQYFSRAGDNKAAGEWFKKALTLAPRDLKTRLAAALWAIELGKMNDAKVQAEAALKIDPKSADAKSLCGVVALAQKDYKTAELYFESAHFADPKNFVYTNNLAMALAEQKDKTKRQRALEYAENNVRQYPRTSEAFSTYGWALYKVGRLEEAEKALMAAYQSGNFSPDAAYYLACVLADRGKEPQARQLLENALKVQASFPQREEAEALLKKLQ